MHLSGKQRHPNIGDVVRVKREDSSGGIKFDFKSIRDAIEKFGKSTGDTIKGMMDKIMETFKG